MMGEDDFGEDLDGGAGLMRMVHSDSASMASDRIEGLRAEDASTPGGDAGRASLALGEQALTTAQGGRPSEMGMEEGVAGQRKSLGGGVAGDDYDDYGQDGGFGGFQDDDAFGGFQLDVAPQHGEASFASSVQRSSSLEESVPGGLATVEALMSRRRSGVEDDEAEGAAVVSARAAEREKAAKERAIAAAAKRRARQAKRAKVAVNEGILMSSSTYREWLQDPSSTLAAAPSASMLLRRLELACGRADDCSVPSGALLQPKRSDVAVQGAMVRSVTMPLSSSASLMDPDLAALFDAAATGRLASKTCQLDPASKASAMQFLASKLAEEQGSHVTASSSSGHIPHDVDDYDMGGGFGGMDDYHVDHYEAASDDGMGRGGAAGSIAGGSELPADVDDAAETESLLGGRGQTPLGASALTRKSAVSADLRSAAVGELRDEPDAPERSWEQSGPRKSVGSGQAPQMHRRTAKMVAVLDNEFRSRSSALTEAAQAAPTAAERKTLQQQAKSGNISLRLHDIISGHSRRTAAVAFYEVLELMSKGVVDIAQSKAYGPIAIRRGGLYDEGLEAAEAAQNRADDDAEQDE
jgi:hypothetical protein